MLKNCLIFSSIFSSSSKLLAQSLEGSSSSGVASSTTTFGAGPSPPPFSKNFRNETPLRGMAVWVAVSSVGTDSVICATECVRIKFETEMGFVVIRIRFASHPSVTRGSRKDRGRSWFALPVPLLLHSLEPSNLGFIRFDWTKCCVTTRSVVKLSRGELEDFFALTSAYKLRFRFSHF
uniref:(northern house mosquito) hypothetical protein n=1 Tax=Culex pipiens TaxID=7175 RepID=A0A8D8HGJ7_CULPI